MEQRRLRLGDILDDYCPRERRVTNHAIVAMIDEDVKQTRCTTCDAEHVYKGGKAPRRRIRAGATAPTVSEPTMTAHEEHNGHHTDVIDEPVAASAIIDQPTIPSEPEIEPEPGPAATDEGPVHRPLIRATLPRPEGIKTERPAPEFTIRQNNGRGNGNFRGRGAHAQGGNSGRSGGARFGRGPQQGQGRGQSRGANQGFGRAAGNQRQGGPKKRSR